MKLKLLGDIKNYSENFKKTHPQAFSFTHSRPAARGFFKKLFCVIGADMLGALCGAGIGGMVANGPGMLFGALIFGTTSSLAAEDIWDDYNVQMRLEEDPTEVVDTFSFRYNLSNEFDTIGTLHNDGLLYLHAAEQSFNSSLTPELQYNLVNTFVSNNYPEYSNLQPISFIDFNTGVFQNPALTYLNDIGELNTTNQYTLIENVNQLPYLNSFQKGFFSLLVTYGVQFNEETYYIAEYFYGIENIIISSSLNENDKQILLSSLATGRASANFWWDVEMGNR